MKKILISLFVTAAITVVSCNNGSNKTDEKHDMSAMKPDSSQQVKDKEDKPVTEISATFSDVDAKIATSIKAIIGHYLHIKNALANDNADEAASGAKAMNEALKYLDKSLLTPEQKKVYDEIGDDLKEHAEHIGKNAGDIEHQREHFSSMSEDVYDLAKAFGGGLPLYHYHCPMYDNGKGAMWLSEMKEIRNPYYGSKMPSCGSLQEKIKQ